MKKIFILSLLLAILAVGAVSAADSEVNNATYDETLLAPEADEATIDEISETLSANADDEETVENEALSAPDGVANDDESDDVLSAPDNSNEDLTASEDEDVLSLPYLKNYIRIYNYVTYNLVYFKNLGYYSECNDLGNLTITIDGEEYYNGQIKSNSYISVGDLKKRPEFGIHDVTYYYSSNYDTFNKTYRIEFSYPFHVYMDVNERTKKVDFQIYLPDDATGNISIMFNNKLHKNVNLDSNGIVSFDIDDFVLGYNEVYVHYSGDSIYFPREIYLDYYMSIVRPIFTYPDVIFDGEDAYVSVTVPKHENGTFVLSIDKNNASSYYGTEYEEVSRIDVVDGTATIKMPKFEGYKYFLLQFFGDNDYYYEYDFESISTNMTTLVKAIATTEVKEGQSVQLRLLNEFMYPVDIIIEVDGKSPLYDLTVFNQTDIVIPDLSAGNHTIVVRTSRFSEVHYLKIFNITVKEKSNVTENPKPVDKPAGTSTNNANSNTNNKVSNKISLSLKSANVKKSVKKVIIIATLKINGKAAKYKTVTFKFNGKTYKVKTNSKGIAKLTIKKSVLNKLKAGKNVKYQVGYSKKLVKKTATVKK